MRYFLLALAFVSLGCGDNTLHTYVSTAGSDTNDCLSMATACRTPQHAADVSTGGAASLYGDGYVHFVSGAYAGGVNITYYKRITFSGDCGDISTVLISAPGANVFNVQDHAIVTVRCMTVTGAGGVGIAARQFSIADFHNVRFGTLAVAVAINEMSKGNCGTQVTLAGPISGYYLAASGMSSIVGGCQTIINPGVTMAAFISATGRSLVDMNGLIITGENPGLKWVNDSSLILNGASVPGASSGNICQNCTIE